MSNNLIRLLHVSVVKCSASMLPVHDLRDAVEKTETSDSLHSCAICKRSGNYPFGRILSKGKLEGYSERQC